MPIDGLNRVDFPKLALGLIQLGIALVAVAAAAGWLDADQSLLAVLIAIQNGLAGTARVSNAGPPIASNGKRPE